MDERFQNILSDKQHNAQHRVFLLSCSDRSANCIYPLLDTSSRLNLLKNLQSYCNKPPRSITDPHRLSIVLNRQSQWEKLAEIDSFSKSLS